MNKLISLGLIVGGSFLIYFGVRAIDRFRYEKSRLVSDTPAEKSVWLPLGLGVASDSEYPPWR